ncbi:MAG: PH domain-containing protein, partial [Acidimicrobiales bacterium]
AFVALRCARAGLVLTPEGVVVRNIVDTTEVPWAEVRGVDGLEAAGFLGWGRCVAVRTVSGPDVIAHRLVSFSPARLDQMLSDIRSWPAPAAGATQPAEPEPGGRSRS